MAEDITYIVITLLLAMNISIFLVFERRVSKVETRIEFIIKKMDCLLKGS